MEETMSLEETIMATSSSSCPAFDKECTIEKSPKSEKKEGKKGCKKCQLFTFDELPDWLKDNEFIQGYYRCEWPMKETILSLFSIHNETFDVWTHLIGFFLFLFLTISTATVIPRNGGSSIASMKYYLGQLVDTTNMTGGQTESFACLLLSPALAANDEFGDPSYEEIAPAAAATTTNCPPNKSSSYPAISKLSNNMATEQSVAMAASEPITRLPFLAFLFGAMLCLLTSSICHLILCHSEQTAYITLRLDYVGIAALIVTSFYPLVFYSFLCETYYRNLYMGFITAFGVATISVSFIPVFQTPEFRPVRAALFSCMGVSGLVPVAHKVILFRHRPEAIISTFYEAFMGLFYGTGVAIYATRVPERWLPGKFDIVGHSHQLFHLFVIAGAYTHYLGGLEYLKWRDNEKCW